jgi:alkylation response protein AidB-like acyl-CoA dehydrogenase
MICGYHDLDLRDATGLGHGRMILRHATEATRQQWVPRLRAGELAGIAMTEAGGGTRIRAITARLSPHPDGGWRLHGEKRWISRLVEAAVFVVFARTPDGAIGAIAVDAASPGIHRYPEEPSGLGGWAWGRLVFDGVPVAAADILAGSDGLELFAHHFAHYRSLVTITALGAAAAAHDIVTAHLADRRRRGEIGRVRDHALIAIARTHAQVDSAVLAALHTQRLAAHEHPDASLWGRTTKAHGVDQARAATDELVVLIGATGFTAGHRLQKIWCDLAALRYADGLHDSLYLSAGRCLLDLAPTPP